MNLCVFSLSKWHLSECASERIDRDPGARPREGERRHDQRKEGRKEKPELLAGDITDEDEEANLGDPNEKENIDDPDEKEIIDDPDEKKNIGDPEEEKEMM